MMLLLLLNHLSLFDVMRKFSRRHPVGSLRVGFQFGGAKLGLSKSGDGKGERSGGLGQESRSRRSFSGLKRGGWGV